MIDLYAFIFDDGNYAFCHCKVEELYIDYADALIGQERFDEAIFALEKAYEHAKGFDAYLDQLRENGEFCYTSTFTDTLKDLSVDVYATKAVPELLNKVLMDKRDTFYKKLHKEERFINLVKNIESDVGTSAN